MSIYDKLQALNIQLPPVAAPAAAYVPFAQTGKLVFLSGQTPIDPDTNGMASARKGYPNSSWAPTT